jgi:hypothetical protein
MAATGQVNFFFHVYTSIGPSQVVQGTFALAPPTPPPRRGYVAFIIGGTAPNSGGTGVQGPWVVTNPTFNPLAVT